MTPAVLKSKDLLPLVPYSRTVLWMLSVHDPLWRSCVIRRTARSTYWSVPRLKAAGLIETEAVAVAQ